MRSGGRREAAEGRRAVAGTALAVDAHAHFHPCYDAAAFLDAALHNVGRWRRAGAGEDRPCLLLADPAGRDSLGALAGALGTDDRWELRSAGEEPARVAARWDGRTVLLVAGRQVATAEGLEVLALATGADLPDGRTAAETVDASLAAGAVTVLPWGFGKWWFGRGRLVRRLVETVADPRFFLGDNGGRPGAAPEHELFRAARLRRIPILPGSDPLPFAGEADRVGSYGFLVPAALLSGAEGEGADDADASVRGLRRALTELDASPPTRGHRVGLGRFLRLQLRMQLRKRVGGT